MGKILVDRDTVDRLKKGDFINRGKEGECYFTKNKDLVVKIYYYYHTKRNVYFDDKEHPQIAYPKDILIDEKSKLITGYTMPYLRGQSFIYGFPKYMELEELKKAYLNLRLVILKQKDIYMDDNCLDNMLYDYKNKKINIIDTSRWYPKKDGQMESICDFNFHMMNAILKVYNYKNNKIIKTKYMEELYSLYNKYYDYYGTCFLRQETSQSLMSLSNIFMEFLKELENQISEYKGEKVKTMNDISIW